MILNRDALLGLKLKRKKLTLPEGDIYVQELTGEQRGEIEILSFNINDDKKLYKKIRPLVAVMAVVDEDGNRLFKDEDADMVNKTLSAKILDAINEAVGELSLTSEDEIKKSQGKSKPTLAATTTG